MAEKGKDPDCIFCQPHELDEYEGEWARIRSDGFPASRGHMLIIPNRHVASFFDLHANEVIDIYDLAERAAHMVSDADGWTIGINEGEAAGRTVHHLHMHLIPRRWGDVPDPRGGVRGVIRGKKVPGE